MRRTYCFLTLQTNMSETDACVPEAEVSCHELYCIRPIGDVNDSVFPLPLFLAIYGSILVT
jgi:hypothetical protein